MGAVAFYKASMAIFKINDSMKKLLDFRKAGNIDSFIFFLTANPAKSDVKFRTKLSLIHNQSQKTDTISNFLRDSLNIPLDVDHEISEIKPDFIANLAAKQGVAVQGWVDRQSQFA